MEKRFPPSVRRVVVSPDVCADGTRVWPGLVCIYIYVYVYVYVYIYI
jgi:hypothetical protein